MSHNAEYDQVDLAIKIKDTEDMIDMIERDMSLDDNHERQMLLSVEYRSLQKRLAVLESRLTEE